MNSSMEGTYLNTGPGLMAEAFSTTQPLKPFNRYLGRYPINVGM
jgi:hypothetical protein